MKKALRIIVPILLAIALIGCMIWYLFVYDREFTRDILLQQARNAEYKGKHELAEWFYNTAYAYADNDESVAIELANQYKSVGNYTKAEYTLSNAIADGGTAELYMALCKTYVEQDKILDAVNMLDNIADPAIKAELEAMRPTAPVADPVSGFYNQYMDVTISSSAGTLYVNTAGEYPTIQDEPYTEPFTLEGGETVVYAISLADNGLVSPLSIFSYTVGGVIEPVVFNDPAFEAAIRSTMMVSEDKTLYTNELWSITEFTMPQDAEVYTDLKFLPYLETLTIEKGISEELFNLSGMGQLKKLSIVDTSISEEDMQIIAGLPMLIDLQLEDCGLSSLEALSRSQSLQKLDVSNNTVRNISALTSLANLQELDLSHNAVTDLSALNTLNSLWKLDISYNALTTVAPICNLKQLTWLNASNNNLTDLSAINNLSFMTYFNASFNSLTDVTPLSGCTSLTELDISANSVSDIVSLSALNNLQYFTFSNNQVTALPKWDTGCALISITGESNLIYDLEPLRGLQNLNNVYLRFNTEITDVDPLAECPKLVEVDVWGSKVADASSLTSQSIIVTFDPTLGHPAA